MTMPASETGKTDYTASYLKLLPELDRLKRELDETHRALQEKATRLKEIEIRDALTGVFNRKHFMQVLDQEWARAVRYQRGFSLVAFDIDHLKDVNEQYGPDTGDNVMRDVVESVKTALRKADTLGRYEGECFLALLPETTAQHTWPMAERMRELVQALPFYAEERTFHVTTSFGISEAFAVENDNSEQLVKRTQKGLTNAKARGCNRVEVNLR